MDSKSEFRRVPVMIPGRQVWIDKVVQPVQRVVEEQVQVQRGETKTVRNEPVVRELQTSEEIRTKNFQAPAKTVEY